ncbi:OVARIAN TUMOR DOMAIN-containing deubiquitinating enzyme 6 [Hirschfeldia incana]|nr:OVARIAN TUMOR DOMAIN-containing deubiquitinating enzyme 6 [Hirschfeldia incana]KAJ0238957.1 OVARIAN TUMOR DOMAIN-containing deubiquitinating enzyme 6 [Hirschfeldia incana]
MARILVQRGSSSNATRSTSSSSASSSGSSGSGTEPPQVPPPATVCEETTDEKQDEVTVVEEEAECSDAKDVSLPIDEPFDGEDNEGLAVSENKVVVEGEGVIDGDSPVSGGDDPDSPPVPVPPPKPSSNRRSILGSFGDLQIGATTRRGAGPRSLVSTRGSPTGSHPSSPRSQSENEGYNSSDEHTPCFLPSHAGSGSGSGSEREHQFETEIRQSKGFEIRRMLEDGNCLFRAVADQVYGDSESYDLTRQMCMDYMEHERDHFSQFITEGFTSYLKRKRRDKVYGNNVEIQALAEMYNRPIHIYSYSTEPINIFQGSYNTDTPPIRLSYHHGNHYNSLVDPHRLTVGAGLGFSSLTGRQVDGEQVKAAIKAQQEHQIDNALIAEGRYYSDLELTEKEIERSVMEASRAEYLMERSKPRIGPKESSTSNAGTSSSGARTSGSDRKPIEKTVLSSSIEMILSMGFSYTQAIEAYSIFGDDVDSMVCYVLETSCGSKNRRKGKATE